eukprot:s5195_g3.t2
MQHLHGRCVQNQHSRPQPQQMSQTRQMHQQRAVVLPQTSARTVMSKGAEQSEAVIRVPSEAMQQASCAGSSNQGMVKQMEAFDSSLTTALQTLKDLL